MPIPVTTYEDMRKARDGFRDARQEYAKVYYDYLNTILEEAGVRNKLVQLAGGTRGQFQVSDDPYTERPWSIKFFPVRKVDGKISRKTLYIPGFYSWEEATLVEQLKNICEVVGDLP